MITRDYSDKDLRAALGSSPPLEKMKMTMKRTLDRMSKGATFEQLGKEAEEFGKLNRELSEKRRLITELVGALERSVLLLRAAAGAIGQDGHDMDFTHVDGIPTDNIGFETDCENSVDRSVAVLVKARAKASHGAGT